MPAPPPAPPQLHVHRRDTPGRALLALAGEIDLDSTTLLRESLAQCLRDGVHAIDVDLAAVTFCAITGLNVFLDAERDIAATGGLLRLHHPQHIVARLFAVAGTGPLLADPPRHLVTGPAPARAHDHGTAGQAQSRLSGDVLWTTRPGDPGASPGTAPDRRADRAAKTIVRSWR